jgi:carbon-monoxide dehydrogenase medium subunit
VKAAPFAYVRPATLDDAVAELVASDGGGKVIAGGQSLVPVLAMRLARPATLVDINSIGELGELRTGGSRLEVGATVRQRRIENHPATTAVPLLRQALPWVGHRELRSRGTVCGSLAHADPAAEIPAVATCLDAQIEIAGPGGRRQVAAREFFSGAMTTALELEDVLTSVRFPIAMSGDGFGFAEIARRHGDFALAGVATHVHMRREHLARATLTAFGVSDRPITRDVSTLLSTAVSDAGEPSRLASALSEPLSVLAQEVVDTDGDAHGSRDYRRRLFVALGARELATAHERAIENGSAVTA